MPSSSLFLRLGTTLISAASLFPSGLAVPQSLGSRQTTTYTLDKQFSGPSFFDQFTFYDQADPTHGYVTYVNKQTAHDGGLIDYDDGYAVMGMDSKTVLTDYNKDHYWNTNGIGRKSVRIESNDYQFTRGLVITDIKQIPGGVCGTWPAFWTLGPTWPYDGEIDIIEGANDQSGNWMALHTGHELSISSPNPGSTSGYLDKTDCNVYTNPNDPNYTGCKFVDTDEKSFGTKYPGGVWAMQWTSESIKVWFWPYGSVPADVASASPKPGSAAWGKPRSDFTPSANQKINDNFRSHRLIFDTTFCGDLGDAVWSSCGKKFPQYGSCAEYVAKNPKAFKDAKWKVKYVKVYKETTGTTSTSTTSTATSTSTAASSTSSSSAAATTTTTSTSSAAVTTTTQSTSTSAYSTTSTTSSAYSTTSTTSSAYSTTSATWTTSSAYSTTSATSSAYSTTSATSAASSAYSITSATSSAYSTTSAASSAYSTTSTAASYTSSTATTAASSTSVATYVTSATSASSASTYNPYTTTTAPSTPKCRRNRPTGY